MFNLLVLSRFDESGAGPRYRVYQYFDHLKKLGINITAKPLLDAVYINQLYLEKRRSYFYLVKKYIKRAIFLLFFKSKFHLVLMDGELFPFVPYFIERLFLPRRYIIDQDDAIFHTYDTHRLWIVRKLFGKKIAKIWKRSQHIIVGNDYVKTKAIGLGARKVDILPTVVDSDIYKPSDVTRRVENEIVIGWVGSPSTVHSLKLVEPILQSIAKQKPICIHIIGGSYELQGVKVVANDWPQGWNEKKEIEQINEIDIGIMPLFDGSLYEKGKCGFKLIKYMSCAKPTVASAVGMNLEIVEHGKNGYLASSLEEWKVYLMTLINDVQKRQTFGNCGREKMVKQYSLKAMQASFGEILMDNLSG